MLENLYRASLVGASLAAESHLAICPQLTLLWGRGDVMRAARLLEVWGSTIAVSLLSGEPDQDAVCRDVARGFATVVFDWSSDDPLLELQAFRVQLETDHKAVMPGGFYIPGKGMELLHLRCVRALGIPVDFKRIQTPIPVGTHIMDLNIVESQYLPSLEDLLRLEPLYTVYIVTSQKVWSSGANLQSCERALTLYAKTLQEVSDSLLDASQRES